MASAERVATTIPKSADELHHQHATLEAEFERVIGAARTKDWRECNELWSELERLLVDHIAFEERELFPSFEKTDRLTAVEAQGLKGEHNELLKRLEQVGDDLQLHHSQHGVEELIALLRRHAKREDAMFYPWLRKRGP